MSKCPARETLSDLADGSLSRLHRILMNRHLRHCPLCTGVLAEETTLRVDARSYLESVKASSGLRADVLSAVTAKLPHEPTSVANGHWQRVIGPSRRWAIAITACVLSSGGLTTMLWRTAPGPGQPIAYAAVEASMRQIKTARWTEQRIWFDSKSKVSDKATVWTTIRMQPPAIRKRESNGQTTIVTPANVSMKRKRIDGVNMQFFVGPGGFVATTTQVPPATAADVIRQRLFWNLLAPINMGKGPRRWISRRVTWKNRTVWQYEIELGAAPKNVTMEFSTPVHTELPLLTRPGIRRVLWVDPATHRVLSEVTDYYDGEQRQRTVNDNFIYDEPIPNTMFVPGPRDQKPDLTNY